MRREQDTPIVIDTQNEIFSKNTQLQYFLYIRRSVRCSHFFHAIVEPQENIIKKNSFLNHLRSNRYMLVTYQPNTLCTVERIQNSVFMWLARSRTYVVCVLVYFWKPIWFERKFNTRL